MIIQSGRPPDPTTAMPASNDSMDTDAVAVVQTDLRVSPRPSFRDMAAGNCLYERKDNFISDLDMDLVDEEAIVNNSGVFPKIRFSNRVHQQIDVKLSKSLIVRLLGRDSEYSCGDKGSRFDVLNVEDSGNPQVQAPVAQLVTSTDEQLSEHPGLPASSSHIVPDHMTKVVVQHQLNSRVSGEIVIEKPVVVESNVVVGETSVVIAAKDKVVTAPSLLKPEKHKAVRILEQNQPRVLKDQNGHQSYGSIRSAAAKGVPRSSAAVNNLPRKEGRVKKKAKLEGKRIAVADWALSLSRSLTKEGVSILKSHGVPVDKSVESGNGAIQWIDNSTFESGFPPPP
ncbi:hypothetical protein V6N12_013023 [Hibiscus sabdariffa]|uniref:Uncharacterized protein n=1 Tax=Hibiscus sabdariffa TaxID=183260 RepID=A0ABR2EG34_9ROSI